VDYGLDYQKIETWFPTGTKNTSFLLPFLSTVLVGKCS
jgi:hypothetical protein